MKNGELTERVMQKRLQNLPTSGTTVLGEHLKCQKECGNTADAYSSHLQLGGLEILRLLTFEGTARE